MTTERRYAPIGRGFFPENDVTVSGDWHFTGTVTFDDPIGTFEPGQHDHSADEITSGQFADALISQSSVTQHQAALSIAYSQITGVPDVGEVDWDDIVGKPDVFPTGAHTHDIQTDIYSTLLPAHFPTGLEISTDFIIHAVDGFEISVGASSPNDVPAAFRIRNAATNDGGFRFRTFNTTGPSFIDAGNELGIWETGGDELGADTIGFRWLHLGDPDGTGDLAFYTHFESASGTEVYRHKRNAAQMLFAAGTAAAPTIAFDDYTSGFFWDSANTRIGVSIGGTAWYSFDSDAIRASSPILITSGSAAAPGYAFSVSNSSGMFWTGGTSRIAFSVSGAASFSIGADAFRGALPIWMVDGSASAPSYSFSGDTDTGLYRIGADSLGISTGNALRAMFSSAEIELNATLFDFNGNADISGTLAVGSTTTIIGNTELRGTTDRRLYLTATSGGADADTWGFRVTSDNLLRIQAFSDDLSSAVSAIQLTRSGTTITEVELNATTLDFNGAADVSGALTVNGIFHAVNNIRVTNTLPGIRWTETDGAADNQVWDVIATSEQFLVRAVNDAITVAGVAIGVNRTGTTIDEIDLNATTLDLNAQIDADGEVHDINAATSLTLTGNAATLTLAAGAAAFGAHDVDLPSGARLDFTDNQATVGSAGGASALPATPTGYINVKVGGAEFVVPYYAAA